VQVYVAKNTTSWTGIYHPAHDFMCYVKPEEQNAVRAKQVNFLIYKKRHNIQIAQPKAKE